MRPARATLASACADVLPILFPKALPGVRWLLAAPRLGFSLARNLSPKPRRGCREVRQQAGESWLTSRASSGDPWAQPVARDCPQVLPVEDCVKAPRRSTSSPPFSDLASSIQNRRKLFTENDMRTQAWTFLTASPAVMMTMKSRSLWKRENRRACTLRTLSNPKPSGCPT